MKTKKFLFLVIASMTITFSSLSHAENTAKLTGIQAIKQISTLLKYKGVLNGVGVSRPCYIQTVNLESFVGGLEISIKADGNYFSSFELMGNQSVTLKKTIYFDYTSYMYIINQGRNSSHVEIWVYTSGKYSGLVNVTISPTDESNMIGLSCRLAQ